MYSSETRKQTKHISLGFAVSASSTSSILGPTAPEAPMTSVDPSHLPIPGTHRTWGQAGYAFNDDEDHPQPTIHLPKIPDLRFEQGYLLSIRPFVKDVQAEEQTGHEKTQEFVKEGVVPGSSTYGVPIRIDWQGVAWVTFRDQVCRWNEQ